VAFREERTGFDTSRIVIVRSFALGFGSCINLLKPSGNFTYDQV
jgi:hypothetical protein